FMLGCGGVGSLNPFPGLAATMLALNPFLRCGVCLFRTEAVGPSGPPVRILRAFALRSAAPGSTANARPRHTPHHRNCIGVNTRPACEARVSGLSLVWMYSAPYR